MANVLNQSKPFAAHFMSEVEDIARRLDTAAIENMATSLASLRDRGGRLFIIGVGGSAANASHAANDFRKLTAIEAYAPTDNVSELTARVNDEGWRTVFTAWLQVSRLQRRDAILVLSVGGGQANVSPNIVDALSYARSVGATIFGIVGRDGGHTAKLAHSHVLIPTVSPERVTPHAEAFQAVIWHLLVSHPRLQARPARWESLAHRELRRAVFLDRDGVLNEAIVRNGKPYAPASVEELRIIRGTGEALARLKERDFVLLGVTNQPEVARGTQKRETAEEIDRQVKAMLPLDDVLACYHDDADGCECRKPRPGLLTSAAQRYGVDLSRSYLIGDRWRDIDAGANAGCKTIWIDRGYDERQPAATPNARVGSLTEAVDWILRDPRAQQDTTSPV